MDKHTSLEVYDTPPNAESTVKTAGAGGLLAHTWCGRRTDAIGHEEVM